MGKTLTGLTRARGRGTKVKRSTTPRGGGFSYGDIRPNPIQGGKDLSLGGVYPISIGSYGYYKPTARAIPIMMTLAERKRRRNSRFK